MTGVHPPDGSVFVLTLSYTAPLDRIDAPACVASSSLPDRLDAKLRQTGLHVNPSA